MMIKTTKTQRGFTASAFADYDGEACSLQESSLATEPAIWFGLASPRVTMMARDAPEELLPPPSDPEWHNGWVDVPVPDGAHVFGRMHLSQSQVAQLLPALQHFAKTGELPCDRK